MPKTGEFLRRNAKTVDVASLHSLANCLHTSRHFQNGVHSRTLKLFHLAYDFGNQVRVLLAKTVHPVVELVQAAEIVEERVVGACLTPKLYTMLR